MSNMKNKVSTNNPAHVATDHKTLKNKIPEVYKTALYTCVHRLIEVQSQTEG